MSESKSFFTTVPGVLTGLAALVTAVGGLLYTMGETGLLDAPPTPGSESLQGSPPPVSQPAEGPAAQGPAAPAPGLHFTGQPVEGWFIIGHYENGRFSDLKLDIPGDSPAIGSRYPAAESFRLVAERYLERGEAVVTLGMVQRGEPVEVLDLHIQPGPERRPVWARLRAVVHPR